MKDLKVLKKSAILTMLALLISLSVLILTAQPVAAGSYSSAVTLPTNGTWSADYWLKNSEDEGWYKFVVPSDGEITCKVMAYMELEFSIYTEDLAKPVESETLIRGTATSPNTKSTSKVLSKGTYYLQVEPWYFNGQGKYKACVSFKSYGTNDANALSYDSPQDVALNTLVTGAITETDDEDWFRFYIPKSGQYRYQITSYFSTWSTLYNADLSDKIIDGKPVHGSELSPITWYSDEKLAKGTYYVKVEGFSVVALGKYSITVKERPTAKKTASSAKPSKAAPKKVTLQKPVSPKKGTLKLTWKRNAQATGYQAVVATNQKFSKNRKTALVKNNKTTAKTFKNLKKKKTYYAKVRAYKQVGKKKVYGAYSKVKKVRVK